MSFNRLLYDRCEESKMLNESMGPGLYQIDTPKICNSCFQPNPMIRAQKAGVSMNTGVDWRFYDGPVDVESELRNINRAISRCPDEKYEPFVSGGSCVGQGPPYGSGVIGGCTQDGVNMRTAGKRAGDNNLYDFQDCVFPTEETRLSNCPKRGQSINRFQPLCIGDPQERVLAEFPMHVNTQLVLKDNWRPCVPTPAIDSMAPPKRPIYCQKITPVCANPIHAGYQYDNCG